MNAQDLINQTPTRRGWTKEQYLKQFYPETYKYKLADKQLSEVVNK